MQRKRDLLCSVLLTLFACLDGTGKLLSAANLDQDVLPSLVENLLDMLGHVDDMAGGNNIVVPVNVAVVHALEPEAVLCLHVLVPVCDFGAVLDGTFAA